MSMTEDEAMKNLETLERFYRIAKSGSALHEVLINFVTLEDLVVAINALSEIQQYRAIGTIEELKALKEKATPKKLEIEKFWGYDDLMCPNCKSYKIRNPKYCCDCGQKLDWEGGAV